MQESMWSNFAAVPSTGQLQPLNKKRKRELPDGQSDCGYAQTRKPVLAPLNCSVGPPKPPPQYLTTLYPQQNFASSPGWQRLPGLGQSQQQYTTQHCQQQTHTQGPINMYLSPSPFQLPEAKFSAPRTADRTAAFTLRCTQPEWSQPRAGHAIDAIDPRLLGRETAWMSSSSRVSAGSLSVRSGRALCHGTNPTSPDTIRVPFCRALGRLKKNVDELCQLVAAQGGKSAFESIETEWRMIEMLCKQYSTLNQRWQSDQPLRSNAASSSDILGSGWLDPQTASSGSLSFFFNDDNTTLAGAQEPISSGLNPFSSAHTLALMQAEEFLQNASFLPLSGEAHKQQL